MSGIGVRRSVRVVTARDPAATETAARGRRQSSGRTTHFRASRKAADVAIVAAAVGVMLLGGRFALAIPTTTEEWAGKDYFTASESPSTKDLLENAERNHLADENFFSKYSRGQFDYAIGDLQYILYVFPNHPRALHFMTSLARLTKRPSLPIAYFQNAIRRFPQHAYTHAQFGCYLAEIGQLDDGIARIETAIGMEPDLAPAYAWLAEAYAKRGTSDAARQAASKARELGYQGKIDLGDRGAGPRSK